MATHARVCWIEAERPWELEAYAIAERRLPLNLAGNGNDPFHATLSGLRRDARARAWSTPAAPAPRASSTPDE